MTSDIDTAVASSGPTSDQPTPDGRPIDGSPLGTGPRMETPCDSRSKAQLTAIAPTTATRPPGTALIQRPQTTSVAITASETARVASDVSGISLSVSQKVITVPLARPSATCGAATPSRPADWESATWMPTPVRKPTSTV